MICGHCGQPASRRLRSGLLRCDACAEAMGLPVVQLEPVAASDGDSGFSSAGALMVKWRDKLEEKTKLRLVK
jgi:hypothetical protein